MEVRDKKALTGSPIRPMRVSPFRPLCVTLTGCSQHRNVDWSKAAPAFRENVISDVEKLGLNHLRRRIRFEKIVTPDDQDSSYEVHHGAKPNMAHNFRQMLHKRPNNRFEDLDGFIWLVEEHTPAAGCPSSTSRLIAEDLGPVAASASRLPQLSGDH